MLKSTFEHHEVMEEGGAPAQDPGASGPEETATIEPKVPEGALPLVALGRALKSFQTLCSYSWREGKREKQREREGKRERER